MTSKASAGMSNNHLLSLLNPSSNLLQPLRRHPHLPSLLQMLQLQSKQRSSLWITGLMAQREALFWRLPMLHLLDRRLMPLIKKEAPGEGTLRGPTVDMLFTAHPAPDLVPKRGLEAGLEKGDPIVLPALCRVVQSQTPIPLDLGLDHALHLRKGIVTVTLRVVPAPHPVPPHVHLPLCPAPLPGGGGIRIPPLVLALGVVPGHGLDPPREEHNGVEADCAVP